MSELSSNAMDLVRHDQVERILDTAERLFKHYGYSKTNVADIARELSMSPANIYRFFSSKAEIHQALARRMLAAQFEALAANAATSASASERLKNHLLIQHRITVDTMMDEQKVHEMVLVALDQQWAVIEEHLQKVRELVSQMISAGIEAGEFREQNVQLAAECFMCCGVSCCHPQLVNKKISSDEIVRPEDLAEFAIRALR